MPAIITDTFDYDDIVRVLDLDEAFVHHQIDALQPKYWRVVIKTKSKGLKIFAPVMVSGNRGFLSSSKKHVIALSEAITDCDDRQEMVWVSVSEE